MLLIAVLHLIALVTSPILAVYFAVRWAPVRFACSLILLSAAAALLTDLWPVDFLRKPIPKLVSPVHVGEYEITFVQWPDVDFYSSWLRVRRIDGKTSCFPIDSDDSKWWRSSVRKFEERLTLFTWGILGAREEFSLDTVNWTIAAHGDERSVAPERLDFNDNSDCNPTSRSLALGGLGVRPATEEEIKVQIRPILEQDNRSDAP